MFEITGDDIALLNDTDLRTLIGRLCEADLRRRGLPTSHVTWGGNQTARDGGLDVRVDLPVGSAIEGFIPKPTTGFQVKKTDMPKGKILDEMKPEGVLRQSVVELAKASGAYIIVSSTGSTADSALNTRRKAMRAALDGVPEADNLTLDFYDRNRIATWVRDHPGLIPWVRERIGKTLQGWQAFGAWSRAPTGDDGAYLFDEQARLFEGSRGAGDGFGAIAGIERLRDLLREPRRAVRLVGLSGVGKTRLCEALFDGTIGKGSLDPVLAAYTNEADEPNPPPIALISDLIASQTRAILVVDNCPADLHRRLTELATGANSQVSLITVEYDIREDQPEGTNVFSLETSSTSVIEKLVSRWYPAISQVDAQTIANFSGGNARLALALAATVGKQESISGLSDADLFKRLFQQRHEHDPDLLSVACACSLVYSFEGVKTEGGDAELPVLAALAGKSVNDVYAAVAELKRRDLLQQRAEWRAVLPHAVANRLAALALQNVPLATVKATLVDNATPRLRRSFSRRLGYLDTSKEAQKIAEAWLAPGGMLADVPNLGSDERAMLANIAPANPAAALATIERSLGKADDDSLRCSLDVAGLLRSLAYDPEHFEQSVALLIALARAAGHGEAGKENQPTQAVTSLFQIVLSGTHAPIDMRLRVLSGLLRSDDAKDREIGRKALDAMLKSDHFSSWFGFEFGSRSRDYGYEPPTGKEVKEWFEAVVELGAEIALSDNPSAADVLACIAGEFRGLWMNGGQVDSLEDLAQAVAKKGFWRDGWISVRQTRLYGAKEMPPAILARLEAVEELLRPKGLVDQVRGMVTGGSSGRMDIEDIVDVDLENIGTSMARADATVMRLGQDVAKQPAAMQMLLPDVLKGGARVWLFGKGIGAGAEDLAATWGELGRALAADAQARPNVIGGFLRGVHERDPGLADKFLDEALEHPSMGAHFVDLQTSVPIGANGIKRLHRALQLGLAHINQFFALAYGRVSDDMPAEDFRELLLAIAGKPGGQAVAIEMLSMRLHSDDSAKRQHAPDVLAAGRELLGMFQFKKHDGRTSREDHELGRIAQASLQEERGIPVVCHLARAIVDAVSEYVISDRDPDDLLRAMVEVHPTIVLDEMFSGDEAANTQAIRLFDGLLRSHKNPLDAASDETLLSWCSADPVVRYPLIAASATLFKRPSDKDPLRWMPITEKLLAQAPDRRAVLAIIVQRLRPMSWSGSLATKLEGRLRLLEQLPTGSMPELATDAEAAKSALLKRIASERQREAAEDKYVNARFE